MGVLLRAGAGTGAALAVLAGRAALRQRALYPALVALGSDPLAALVRRPLGYLRYLSRRAPAGGRGAGGGPRPSGGGGLALDTPWNIMYL